MDGKAMRAGQNGPVAQAAKIVQDATEVDWSRDPLTEYEAEIRRTWLAQQMERGPFGRIEIADLAFGLDECGTDLQEALDGLFMLAEVRSARQQRRSLRSARNAVNRAQPRGCAWTENDGIRYYGKETGAGGPQGPQRAKDEPDR